MANASRSSWGYLASMSVVALEAIATDLAPLQDGPWASIALNPLLWASIKICVGSLGSKKAGDMESAIDALMSLNSKSCLVVHLKCECFLVSSRSDAVRDANAGMKSWLDVAMHKNETSSYLLVGGGAWYRDLIFSGSGEMPFVDTLIPQKEICSAPMWHFYGLSVVMDS